MNLQPWWTVVPSRAATVAAALVVTAAASPAPAPAQIIQRVKDRVQQRIEERLGESLDRAVDRAMQGPELKAETARADEGEEAVTGSTARAVRPAPAGQPGLPGAARESEGLSRQPREAAQDSVARREALQTGFRDADLIWLLPLARAERADRDGQVASGMERFEQFRGRASTLIGRADEIASGKIHALEELRRYSPLAVAPPEAMYDARCSAEATSQMGFVTAVLVLPGGAAPDIADKSLDRTSPAEQLRGMQELGETSRNPAYRRAIEWYDRQPEMSAGQNGPNAKVTTEDGRIEVYLNSFNAFADHAGCAHVVGPVIRIVAARIGTAGFESPDVAPPASRLARALRRADLSEEEMQQVRQRVIEASIDARLGEEFLERSLSGAALALRKRNRAWFERNREAIEPVAALYLGQ